MLNDVYTKSDHFIVQVDLEMSPDRKFLEKRDYSNADGPQLRRQLEHLLKAIEEAPLDTNDQRNQWLDACVSALAEVDKTIPTFKSTQRPFADLSPMTRDAFADAKRLAADYNVVQTPDYLEKAQDADCVAKELWKLEKEHKWHDHMNTSTANLAGAYKKYHWALSRERTRDPALMPPIIDPKDPTITHTTVEAKSDCLAEALLLVPVEQDTQRTVPDLPFDCDPNDLPTCNPLTYDEIDQIMRKMPRIKAVVEGGISNTLLKICREVLVPHFLRFCKYIHFTTT